MIIMNPYRHAGVGSVIYLYYQLDVTAWNDVSWCGMSEIALYDDLGNVGNLGIGNGELNIHGTSGTLTADQPGISPSFISQAASGIIGDPDNRYIDNAPLATYIRWQFDTKPANPILAYTIWSANSSFRFPKDWTFEGSDNGSDWTFIETRTGESVGSIYTPKDFII